ncbi:CHAP domain-containing protein [Actinomadura rubrisoli]|uniref:CHAP domain-containing protein n=1 Tax=Actinomadura rubrisoli TaxID=2530368 RepID=A0A4R5C9D6_9ACTN|nr:CHAP domain-containing protein [Actinomadura rubrisoli]TDD95845.1 CHAP domain-containing protein [Actinomadura rubrisoli]
MGTAAAMLAQARKSIGMSGRPNTITREYAGRHGDEFLRASWCDMAVTYWARHSGNAGAVLLAGDRAYTVWHAEDFQKAGRWHSGTTAEVNRAKPGDIVFFDWGTSDSLGAIDHVGVVEKALGGGRVQTIEGNTSDKCLRRVRGAGTIAGYGRPAYSDEEDDMPLSSDDLKKIRDIVWNTDTAPAPAGAAKDNPTWRHVNLMRDTYSAVREVQAAVAKLAQQSPDVDAAEVARLVLAGLTPESIAAAIPDEHAEHVATALGKRLTSGG